MKHFVFVLACCVMCLKVSAQKDPERWSVKIDSLKKLGRDSLIKLAAAKEKEDGFDASGYDRVEVKAYKDRLVVDFSLSVTLKDGSCFYDHVSIALVGSGSGSGIEGGCDKPKYHTYTSKRKKKIQFVFDAINKSDEIGHLKDNKVSPGSHMTISEHLTYYYVEHSSWSTYSHYKVDKLTGKISEAGHKHYARGDDEEKQDHEVIK